MIAGMPLHRGQAEEIRQQGMAQGQNAGLQAGLQAGFMQGADKAAADIMSRIDNSQPEGASSGGPDPRMEKVNEVAGLMVAAKQGDRNAMEQLKLTINDLSEYEEGLGILEYADQLVTDAENPDKTPTAGVPR